MIEEESNSRLKSTRLKLELSLTLSLLSFSSLLSLSDLVWSSLADCPALSFVIAHCIVWEQRVRGKDKSILPSHKYCIAWDQRFSIIGWEEKTEAYRQLRWTFTTTAGCEYVYYIVCYSRLRIFNHWVKKVKAYRQPSSSELSPPASAACGDQACACQQAVFLKWVGNDTD